MNNNVLLSLAVSISAVVVMSFVALMTIYKVYVKIRSYFNAAVNCWFCNENTKVPYVQSNSWTCPFCDQYNGFTKNGDYNRIIYEQLDCSKTSQHSNNGNSKCYINGGAPVKSNNGFCGACNEAQRLKVEKLAQFEPKKESNFNKELKAFKKQLEEKYGLCGTCERHLRKVLREKRKMVLGSKFLDIIIKGAYSIKQPYLNQLQYAKQRQWKQRCRWGIIILTIINLMCLYESMPALTREHITYIIGTRYGIYIFTITSHVLALLRVFYSYWQTLCQAEILIKLGLFCRTLFFMFMYSMGLRITHMNLSSLFCSIYPFSVLLLALTHQLIDGFCLTAYTFLMTIWSLLASGLWDFNLLFNTTYFLSFMSLLTLVLTCATKPKFSPKLHDNSHNSFHKLYSDDYLSDEDDELNDSVSSKGIYVETSVPVSSRSANFTFSPSPFTKDIRRQLSPVTSLFNMHYSNGMAIPTSSPPTALPFGQEDLSVPLLHNGTKPLLYATNFSHSDYNNCVPNLPQSLTNLSNKPTAPTPNATIINSEYIGPNLLRPQSGNFCRFTSANHSTLFNGGNVRSYNFESMNVPCTPTHLPLSPYARPLRSMNENYINHMPTVTPNNGYNWAMKSTSSPSNVSWVSGGYFNQAQSLFQQPFQSNNGNRNISINNNNTIENVSRASSRSSGFESQKDFISASRENSSCRDINDYQQQQQQILNAENANGFQSIDLPKERNAESPASVRPSLLRNSTLNLTSLDNKACESVGYILPENRAIFTPQQQLINRKAWSRGRAGAEDDIFNLHQINDQLLTIRPSECRIYPQKT